MLLLWVGMVVPATVLVSSVSFALGTLFPRQSMLVKIVILLAWFIGAIILPAAGLERPDTLPLPGTVAWDPTSAATAFGYCSQYQTDFQNQFATCHQRGASAAASSHH